MQNEIENFEITSINFVRKNFGFKLQSLCMHMTTKVHAILVPFLAFASTYYANKAYNMLALMLDPHLKSLDVVKTFVKCVKVTHMVIGYDNKTLMPILVVAFQFFSFGIDGLIRLTLVDDNDDSIFWEVTSTEATLQRSLKIELFLFYHLHM
jgi:hypothetical protein